MLRLVLLLFIFGLAPVAYATTPCDGIDRSLTDQQKQALAPVIVHQLNYHRIAFTSSLPHVSKVDVLQAFRSDGWSIIYVAPDVADEAFLFYSSDPLKNNFVTVWAGSDDQQQNVEDGIIKDATGIPKNLAGCFAWWVTKGNYGE